MAPFRSPSGTHAWSRVPTPWNNNDPKQRQTEQRQAPECRAWQPRLRPEAALQPARPSGLQAELSAIRNQREIDFGGIWIPNEEEEKWLQKRAAMENQHEDESDDEDLQNWVLRRQEERAGVAPGTLAE